jgi:hypothetical protein
MTLEEKFDEVHKFIVKHSRSSSGGTDDNMNEPMGLIYRHFVEDLCCTHRTYWDDLTKSIQPFKQSQDSIYFRFDYKNEVCRDTVSHNVDLVERMYWVVKNDPEILL